MDQWFKNNCHRNLHRVKCVDKGRHFEVRSDNCVLRQEWMDVDVDLNVLLSLGRVKMREVAGEEE